MKKKNDNLHIENDAVIKKNEEKSKTKKKKRVFRILSVFLVLFIIWWFNNYTLKTNSFVIYSEKITSKIRIAILSDLHATEHGISNEKILKRIEKSEPDIVFILGDMYSRDSAWDKMQIPIRLTEMITEQGYTVYFVPGEHDTSQLYIDYLTEAGAHVMDYKTEQISIKGNNLQIFGIDNVYYSPTFDLNSAFTLNNDYFNILMAHIPNYEKFSEFGADLTLCGDTHGGIIQLPFSNGPVYYSENSEWFPELTENRADVFDKGMFPYNNGTMFITSGIGAYPFPLRFNNRPEIAIIDIKPEGS